MKLKNAVILSILVILSLVMVYGGINTLSVTSPSDNTWTTDTTPEFNITVVGKSFLTLSKNISLRLS